MKRALFLAMFFAATTSIVAQDPDSQASSRSPKGTYQIGKENAAQEDHELSIARRDRPNTFYRFYTYPRFAEVSFSPDESFLVITDHVGSGATECVLLQRIDKPSFFGKPQKIDEAC